MTFPHQMADAIQQVTVWAIPLILAITLHEAAHGFAAWRLGDDTALRMGRVSANPLHHIDPFGTILLPALLLLSGTHFLFGWAKPMPVNFGRLRPIRAGMVLVSLAGPATNILLAVLSALLLYAIPYIPSMGQEWAIRNLNNSVAINLVLAVFNMLPLPPLDGGRALVAVLPRSLALPLANMERYTIAILMVGLFVLPMIGFDLFAWIIGIPVDFLARVLFSAVGLL